MSWNFSFSTPIHLDEDESGIYVTALLSVAGREVEINGYLDTGAAYCVIPRWAGERLGLNVESGQSITMRTGGGPMPTYLHYATITISTLTFEDVPICVAKYSAFDRCLLGRAGWLQKVRMNLITYDNVVYLNLHDQ